ncbi:MULTISPECIES: glycoside hydrolase family 75 protein [unclassified Crossiella]|uniref:glycoside hydrolase family 75 protein n=1 Tax=unclassified Crossiella TaxID=2620835 RepID=UPI001FFE429D|nr:MULTISPECIES: glycoside hydrolase family 75 protein [unclassified Crossiella]MCK2244000.1 glycoside hydrolase family 75 protein [Crossiella sp. S99.2]MCK2257142.1 glycoside hydrolase family 75 protein [Crossiella sp. S99.1]
MRKLLVLAAGALLAVTGLTGPTAAAAPAGGPTAAQLLAKVASCNQISTGKYRTDTGTGATVPVCGQSKVVHWRADLDIDCDGQITPECNKNTDPWFQPDTAFHQSDGKPLISAKLPYVVVPSPSGTFDYRKHGIAGGGVVAVIYNNKVQYAVVGDTGPANIIGEASYAAAKNLGINPDPHHGGSDGPVTYIFFKGSKVSPIENAGKAVSAGEQLATAFVGS